MKYAVYVTHEVLESWIEWFDNVEEATQYYQDMMKTPDQQAVLLQVLQ